MPQGLLQLPPVLETQEALYLTCPHCPRGCKPSAKLPMNTYVESCWSNEVYQHPE